MSEKSAEIKKPLSHEERLKELYDRQKDTLDLFLKTGAISQEQHDKSLGDLRVKMGITEAE